MSPLDHFGHLSTLCDPVISGPSSSYVCDSQASVHINIQNSGCLCFDWAKGGSYLKLDNMSPLYTCAALIQEEESIRPQRHTRSNRVRVLQRRVHWKYQPRATSDLCLPSIYTGFISHYTRVFIFNECRRKLKKKYEHENDLKVIHQCHKYDIGHELISCFLSTKAYQTWNIHDLAFLH